MFSVLYDAVLLEMTVTVTAVTDSVTEQKSNYSHKRLARTYLKPFSYSLQQVGHQGVVP